MTMKFMIPWAVVLGVGLVDETSDDKIAIGFKSAADAISEGE